MVQAMSLFNQLLQHFPSLEFAALVKKHGAERAAKGFSCRAQLVAMLFCQLAHADSLREICNGLACCVGKLVHLGIGVAPNKSTLAYANQHRPAKLYEELFYTALGRFRDEKGLGVRKQRFRFKNKLLSLDSTTISLCLEMFPWAKFRRAKGGVKAHVLLDHDDYMPRYVLITEARRSDVKMADAFPLNPGSIVVMDRGYNDYALFGKWTDEGINFVTRLKDNAAYEVLEEVPVPENRNIRSDQLIRFTGEKAQKDCPCLLRRVVVWDPINEREIVLLTNLQDFGPTTIAAIYKDRWEIELFFKALKQNLKVKTRRYQRKRPADSDLDSPDRHSAAQMASPSFQSQVVAVEPRFHAAYEPLYLPRFDRMARQPLRYARHSPRISATYPRAGLIWTGYSQRK
jgi:hypothetical protein